MAEVLKKEPTGKTALSAKINFKREKDKQMVKGIFRFYEAPGGVLKFPYKAYKGDAVETYSLVDGKVYTLPLGVAKHLNSGGYPEYEYIKGESDKTLQGADNDMPMRVAKMIKRFGFQSLEFLSDSEIGNPDQPQVVLAEKA